MLLKQMRQNPWTIINLLILNIKIQFHKILTKLELSLNYVKNFANCAACIYD